MKRNINQLSLFFDEVKSEYDSACEDKSNASFFELYNYYNRLNEDSSHKLSNDDICTPMECVKKMIDYIPAEFWKRKNIKILDPCCGNGNFGAYCKFKT